MMDELGILSVEFRPDTHTYCQASSSTAGRQISLPYYLVGVRYSLCASGRLSRNLESSVILSNKYSTTHYHCPVVLLKILLVI